MKAGAAGMAGAAGAAATALGFTTDGEIADQRARFRQHFGVGIEL
jgi:hypothetical protein